RRSRTGTAFRGKSECACCKERPIRPLHQILLCNREAEPIVVGYERLDELVKPALKNLFHPAVLEPGTNGARLALCRALAAVGLRGVVEVARQIFVAAGKRAR